MPETDSTPSVLFVCVKNAGKSQMAAGLMRRAAGGTVEVHPALLRGIDGIERVRLVRDDIAGRVEDLAVRLATATS
jgi:arsenate-mycothiol transferase